MIGGRGNAEPQASKDAQKGQRRRRLRMKGWSIEYTFTANYISQHQKVGSDEEHVAQAALLLGVD